jgi:hypothetical protein
MSNQVSLPDAHGRRMLFSPFRLRREIIRDAFSRLDFVGATVSAAESLIGFHYAYETDVLVVGGNRFLNSVAAYLLGMRGIRVVSIDAASDDSVPWNTSILDQHEYRVLVERICSIGTGGATELSREEWSEIVFGGMATHLAVRGDNTVFSLSGRLSPAAYMATKNGFLVNVKTGGCAQPGNELNSFVRRIPTLQFPAVGKRCQRFVFAKRIIVTSQLKGFFPCRVDVCKKTGDRNFVYEMPGVFPTGAAAGFPVSTVSALNQPVRDLMSLHEYVLK